MALLRTEDTGKIFEKAICIALGIAYDGNYKYCVEKARDLSKRLLKLKELTPYDYTHTARRGARYDFTSTADATKHLSAKSTKKGVGKIAPQVIGQCQPQKFCTLLNIPFTTNRALKEYIQTNITTILPTLLQYTFDCPNLYYNQQANAIKYILLKNEIDWSGAEFKWTCDWKAWANSSTLKLITPTGSIALLEFQFHTKSRTNMAIRWCYETLLSHFESHFDITSL
jgi:hypothetical protein